MSIAMDRKLIQELIQEIEKDPKRITLQELLKGLDDEVVVIARTELDSTMSTNIPKVEETGDKNDRLL